jgi:hypothetical protein
MMAKYWTMLIIDEGATRCMAAKKWSRWPPLRLQEECPMVLSGCGNTI